MMDWAENLEKKYNAIIIPLSQVSLPCDSQQKSMHLKTNQINHWSHPCQTKLLIHLMSNLNQTF